MASGVEFGYGVAVQAGIDRRRCEHDVAFLDNDRRELGITMNGDETRDDVAVNETPNNQPEPAETNGLPEAASSLKDPAVVEPTAASTGESAAVPESHPAETLSPESESAPEEVPVAYRVEAEGGESGTGTVAADVGPAANAAVNEGAPPVPPAVEETAAKAEETQQPAVAATEEAPVEETARRKVQLNPTQGSAPLQAVPSLGGAPAAGEAEIDAEVAAATSGKDPLASSSIPPLGSVDLPPKQTPLDTELEAEIAAAMAGAVQTPAASAPTGEAGASPTNSLADQLPATEDQLAGGMRLKAKVQTVTAEEVFCDVGYRAPGMLPVRQFPQGKQPREGEEFLVVVDKYDPENGVIHVSLPKATRKVKGGWEELQVGQIVDCTVNRTNKGGLEVTVANMRGFLPASQVDVGFVSSLDAYVGQKFPVQITEVNPAKRNLVVSRKAIVVQERREASTNFWQQAEVGQQYSGRVKTIKDYGAFIDIGGIDGFLHVGEMSWTRIKHPSDVLQEGQQVEVVILSLDREKEKIGLGMRQLAHNPWAEAVDKYAVGKTVSGKVTRATDFGAFIELEAGVEGLVHISELDHRRVRKVTDILAVGQEVQVQVLEVAPERQRISLSVKALKAKPEEPKDEDLSPGKGQAYERKRKEPLRGGNTGPSASSGGLFGDPNQYR